jgi:hypothetical protein
MIRHFRQTGDDGRAANRPLRHRFPRGEH